MMQKRFLQVKVIRGYVNAGFVWANNHAIHIEPGRCVPLLNMVSFMEGVTLGKREYFEKQYWAGKRGKLLVVLRIGKCLNMATFSILQIFSLESVRKALIRHDIWRDRGDGSALDPIAAGAWVKG